MPSPNPTSAPARRGPRPKPRALELRITIANIDPPIWRAVRVPDEYTLEQLHSLIQLIFGWLDYHLYGFSVGERRFEEPHEESHDEDASTVTLRDLSLKKGAHFTYTYDWGDGWVHEIAVEDVYISTPLLDGDPPMPLLRDGERAGPPEDCGGPYGYQDMIDALRDPEHEEHAMYRRWAANGYDPDRFDVWMARNTLTLTAAWGAI